MARKPLDLDPPPEPESATTLACRRRAMDRAGRLVLEQLGVPPGLAEVRVHKVDTGCFRVNVHVRADQRGDLMLVRMTRIAHSYYVSAGKCRPAVKRLYT